MCFRTRRRALIPTLRVAAEKEPTRQSFISKAGGGQETLRLSAIFFRQLFKISTLLRRSVDCQGFGPNSIENLDKEE
jgi:hypothetical protein